MGVSLPYVVLVPYWNHHDVWTPWGLTCPFSVALVSVTAVAECVTRSPPAGWPAARTPRERCPRRPGPRLSELTELTDHRAGDGIARTRAPRYWTFDRDPGSCSSPRARAGAALRSQRRVDPAAPHLGQRPQAPAGLDGDAHRRAARRPRRPLPQPARLPRADAVLRRGPRAGRRGRARLHPPRAPAQPAPRAWRRSQPTRSHAPAELEHLEWLRDPHCLALFHAPRRPRRRRSRRPRGGWPRAGEAGRASGAPPLLTGVRHGMAQRTSSISPLVQSPPPFLAPTVSFAVLEMLPIVTVLPQRPPSTNSTMAPARLAHVIVCQRPSVTFGPAVIVPEPDGALEVARGHARAAAAAAEDLELPLPAGGRRQPLAGQVVVARRRRRRAAREHVRLW